MSAQSEALQSQRDVSALSPLTPDRREVRQRLTFLCLDQDVECPVRQLRGESIGKGDRCRDPYDKRVGFKAAVNGKYVAAESFGTKPLLAGRTAISTWEKFTLG